MVASSALLHTRLPQSRLFLDLSELPPVAPRVASPGRQCPSTLSILCQSARVDGSPRSPCSPNAPKKDRDSPTSSDASFGSSLGSSSLSLTSDEGTHPTILRAEQEALATSLPQSPNSTPKAARRVQFALPQGDSAPRRPIRRVATFPPSPQNLSAFLARFKFSLSTKTSKYAAVPLRVLRRAAIVEGSPRFPPAALSLKYRPETPYTSDTLVSLGPSPLPVISDECKPARAILCAEDVAIASAEPQSPPSSPNSKSRVHFAVPKAQAPVPEALPAGLLPYPIPRCAVDEAIVSPEPQSPPSSPNSKSRVRFAVQEVQAPVPEAAPASLLPHPVPSCIAEEAPASADPQSPPSSPRFRGRVRFAVSEAQAPMPEAPPEGLLPYSVPACVAEEAPASADIQSPPSSPNSKGRVRFAVPEAQAPAPEVPPVCERPAPLLPITVPGTRAGRQPASADPQSPPSSPNSKGRVRFAVPAAQAPIPENPLVCDRPAPLLPISVPGTRAGRQPASADPQSPPSSPNSKGRVRFAVPEAQAPVAEVLPVCECPAPLLPVLPQGSKAGRQHAQQPTLPVFLNPLLQTVFSTVAAADAIPQIIVTCSECLPDQAEHLSASRC
jgi:hypothetical protein